jgi:cobalt-zinc-cadmium efflux system outer membrane protein
MHKKSSLIAGGALVAAFSSAQPITLTDALAAARLNRPAITAARLQVERLKAEGRSQGAYPGLTFGVGQSTRDGLGATDQDLFLSVPIDAFGRTRSAKALGSTRVSIAEAQLHQTELEVQTEVVDAYLRTLAASQALRVAQDLLVVAEKLTTATNRRFEEGKIPEVQLIRTKLERERAQQTVARRAAEFSAAQSRLKGTTASSDGSPEVAGVDLAIPGSDPSRRPDLLVLSEQVREYDAQSTVARKSNLPELELVALRSPWRESSVNYGARLQLTWKIVDFGRAKNESRSAELGAKSVRELLRDATVEAIAKVSALDIQIRAASERVASYEKLRAGAADLVERSQRGFAEGFGSLLDVLDATRALRDIEQELVEARLDYNLSIAAKYAATGTLLEVAA